MASSIQYRKPRPNSSRRVEVLLRIITTKKVDVGSISVPYSGMIHISSLLIQQQMDGAENMEISKESATKIYA